MGVTYSPDPPFPLTSYRAEDKFGCFFYPDTVADLVVDAVSPNDGKTQYMDADDAQAE